MALSDLGSCRIEFGDPISLALHSLITHRIRLISLHPFKVWNPQVAALVQVFHVGPGFFQSQQSMVSTGLAEQFVRELGDGAGRASEFENSGQPAAVQLPD